MQTSRPALVVSIHDVSPLTEERVKTMLGDLENIGVGKISLLVVPNHHHRAPILENAGFCRWLAEITPSPHEAVVHGYYHLRPRQSGGGWWSSLVTEKYTAGEGEFYDLSRALAAERLETAKREFREAGLQACGFIAPAWLLGAEAEEAVRATGFEYTTRLGTFKDLGTGRETESQSLVWSVRTGWRRVLSLGWNGLLFRRLTESPLMRVGLHPPDWDHPAIRRQILELIRTALAGREAMTYEGWLKRERSLA